MSLDSTYGRIRRQSEETIMKQMWSCEACGISRQWGFNAPEDPELRPQLLCEGTCTAAAQPKAHRFTGLV